MKERLLIIQIKKLFLFLVNGVPFQISVILLFLNPFGLLLLIARSHIARWWLAFSFCFSAFKDYDISRHNK